MVCLFALSKMLAQGDTLSFSLVDQDSLREYILYVPAAYDGTEDWPLVISYHEGGMNATAHMGLTGMNAVADTGHFLVAYPQGLVVLNPILMAPVVGWNESEAMSDNDDVSFTSALLSQVSATYSVDLARVYAAGLGMGGAMANKVLCELPDKIAAVATAGNLMTDLQMETCMPERPVSALYIIGVNDPFIPFAPNPQHPIITQGLEGTIDFWRQNNNCSADSTVVEIEDSNTEDSTTITLISYTDCLGDTELAIYRVNNGGHIWPGATLPDFFGRGNQDMNASSEIWNFFNRQRHPNPPGKVLQKSFVHADSLRSYLLYVPYAYDGTEDWPLVLSLHGYALDAPFQMAFSGMNEVADTAHFLVAYPQGTTFISTVPNIPPQGLGWSVGLPTDTAFISPGNVDDVDFLGQVIDSIQAEFQLAPRRVYATGFSNGAMMSNLLGLSLSDRIAAIAPVGGTLPESQLLAQPEGAAVPILYIHGTGDPIVPYGEGDPFLVSVSEILNFWISRNGCELDPVITTIPNTVTTDNSTAEWQEWQNCTQDVVHIKVLEGGHQWPGGENLLPFLGPFNLDFDASEEIWNFFNRHQLPDPSTAPDRLLDPAKLKLQVYPNPVSTELTIELELSRTAPIQVTLKNLLGQQMAIPFKGNLATGMHRLSWQVDQALPAGMYLLHLQIGQKQLAYPLIFGEH